MTWTYATWYLWSLLEGPVVAIGGFCFLAGVLVGWMVAARRRRQP